MKPAYGPDDLVGMIADYMEAGFLENITDLFRHDRSLYKFIANLIQDERVRVRIGVTAMMEELKSCDTPNLSGAIPNLAPLLNDASPSVRGDAANLLGIIGGQRAAEHLKKALEDENPDVRLIAREAIEGIKEQRILISRCEMPEQS